MADEQPIDANEPDVGDVSLIDNAIAPKTDDAPVNAEETPTEEGSDDQDKPAEEEQKESSEGDEQAPAEKQEPAQDEEAARREHNAQMAARRIQDRERTRQQIAQNLEQHYGPKTEEQLVDEGMTPEQAQIQALREEMQFERQKATIAELNAGLQSEAVNVYNDFPVFNDKSNEYDPDFAKEVETAYQQAARLQFDEYGNVLNAEVPLYDFYQRMANIYSRGATKGAQQGQQEYQQMLARTENPGGSSSTAKGDDLESLEERLGDMVIT